MRTRVKICGITRVEDGIAAARSGAHAIGVVFWPGTPRAVAIEQARRIVDALPPFVSVVGLFVDPQPEDVRAALSGVRLDLLQFHGDEPAELCRSFGRAYLKALPVKPGSDLLQCVARYPDASAVLFDTHLPGAMPGGTGTLFDWSALPTHLSLPLVLSGGLTAENVGAGVRRVRPWAVDVSSGVEAVDREGRPLKGIKDPLKIAAFIAAVHRADA